MLRSSEAAYLLQQRYATVGIAAARRSWRLGHPGGLLPSLTVLQQLAAQNGAASVDAMLTEQNIDAPPEATVNTNSLAGVASDGRPLVSLLEQAATVNALELMAVTQIADAARIGAGLSIATRLDVGWTRMVNPPCCARCAVLAGKFFKWNKGFQRHPACFPAGTVVSGPEIVGATRRWYEGELVTVRTASGQKLSMTANHPVLTREGWLPARLLVEGGDVVRSTSGDRAVGLEVPHEDQMPALVEDVWRSGRMRSVGRMPVAAEDFHGDGVEGHVDVVLADRLLRDRRESTLLEQVGQQLFARGAQSPDVLAGSGSREELLLGDPSSRSTVRGLDLPPQLIGWGSADSHQARRAAAPDGHTGILQAIADHGSADSEALRDGVFALPAHVRLGERGRIKGDVSPRWDAPADPYSVESRGGYASRGQDLFLRLAGQVALDRIVEVTRIEWSGHVYNLTSAEGWLSADGLIVSNCDCTHIPTREDVAGDVRTDPKALFDSGRVNGVTQAEQKAITAGADVSRVINARRSLYMDDAGHRFTREATTRRGGVKGPRPTPEQIYRTAGDDQAAALRALKKFGYLI